MGAQHWITRAEAALGGAPEAEVELVGTRTPPLLDADGIKAALAPLLAAFFWASSVFEEQLSGSPMDPIALILRLLALGMTLRTVVLGRMMLQRQRIYRQSARYGLALTDEGLLYRTPEGDIAVPRSDILAIRTHGDFRDRPGRRRFREVYVVTRPSSGRTHLSLPPVLGESPGWLAEQLERWLGVVEGPPDYAPPEPSELPSKLFDAAAAGDKVPGITALPHGSGWLRRGPYATVLMGLALAMGFFRLPAAVQEHVGLGAPLIIAFALLGVPLLWLGMTRADIAPRKGLALLLTPAEIMMRTRGGVHVVPYGSLRKVEITSRFGWSLLQGQHEARALVIHRRDADYISYVEAFLGTPAEVVQSLIDAYRRGLIPASPERAD